MVLILIAPSGEQPDPAFAESVAMDFQPLASNRVTKWIVHYAKTSWVPTSRRKRRRCSMVRLVPACEPRGW
jgi:hypothetical protein